MLVALTASGERFVCSSELSREKLKQQRVDMQFFCPQCKERLQLKIGELKIPHFSHIANSQCEQLFSEGESEQHLRGKEQLYKMFKRLQLKVELECYLKELAQRPDLLVTDKNGRRFAIEFQCSPISPERYSARTNGYLSSNITPIWLFLTPSKKVRTIQKVQKLSFSPMLQQMLRGNGSYQQYIVTYDPERQHFSYFSNLLHLFGDTYIAKYLPLPIQHQHFPFYEPAPLQLQYLSDYARIYAKYRNQFVQAKLLTSKKGINDPFLRACYEMRFNLQSLPSDVGIPVPDASAIPMFTLEWQILLQYDCKQKGLSVTKLSSYEVNAFLKSLDVAIFPEMRKAIWQYGSFLENSLIQYSFDEISLEAYMANELHSTGNIEKIKE